MASISGYFTAIFAYASDWSTLTGALSCIKGHWLVFVLYWLYYFLNILIVYSKSQINAWMLLFIALAGLPVYALIWWYVLVPTIIAKFVGSLMSGRHHSMNEDKIMGYLMLRAIGRAGE